VNQVYGFDWAEIGRAALSLAEARAEMRLDALGGRPRRRNLRVSGPGGTDLGTITVRNYLWTRTETSWHRHGSHSVIFEGGTSQRLDAYGAGDILDAQAIAAVPGSIGCATC
jgi:hypothetical protein